MNNSKFPKTIVTALWANSDGGIRSMVLDEYLVNALKEAASKAEVGGRIVIQPLTQEQREAAAERKDKELSKIHTHFLKVVPKSEVDAYNAYRQAKNGGKMADKGL